MALIRKLIDIGKTSRGRVLPKSWLTYHEKKNGKKSLGLEWRLMVKL